MKTAVYKIDENGILNNIFYFLANNSLENISIREICKGTGYTQGSLYYWFGDKTNMICECTQYGLEKVTEQIFDYVFESLGDLPLFFKNCLDRIAEYKNELRFIYQMTASPVYGKIIAKNGKYFKTEYSKYAERLAAKLNCDLKKLKPIVYIFVSAVCDYAIWEDKESAQTQIDYIASVLPQMIDSV